MAQEVKTRRKIMYWIIFTGSAMWEDHPVEEIGPFETRKEAEEYIREARIGGGSEIVFRPV